MADESSAAAGEFLFAPKAALHALQKLKDHVRETKNLNCNVLFVFDHVLLHQAKESHVYTAAQQALSPINVISELMEQTGVFPTDGSSVTSIMILDTESTSEQWTMSEKKIIDHIESIADQIVPFGHQDDQNIFGVGSIIQQRQSLRGGQSLLPVLGLRPGQVFPNEPQYLRPYVSTAIKGFRQLLDDIHQAHVKHVGAK